MPMEKKQNRSKSSLPATYYLKNGKHYVIYDEIVEGMPGSIRNTVKITGDSMFEVTKNGRSGSRMVFEKDKMNMTNYQTPYGEVLVGTIREIFRFMWKKRT